MELRKVQSLARIAALVALGFAPLLSGRALAADDSKLWQTNYKQALAQAAKENKQVLLDFTGSDWCRYCIQMDREVLSKPQFESYASKKLVLVKLDFPRRKKLSANELQQNDQLQSQYGIEGFPTYVLLDAQGKEVRRVVGSVDGGPSVFIKWIEGAQKAE
jgi:thiol:disulfide interchange protein